MKKKKMTQQKLLQPVVALFVLLTVILLGYILYSNLYKKVNDAQSAQTNEVQNQDLINSFEQFYSTLNEADKNNDYKTLYQFLNPIDKKYLTLEDVQYQVSKRPKLFSHEVQIHDIEVGTTSAQVNRTMVLCLTQKCEGKDRTEDTQTKVFVLVDTKWFLPAQLGDVSSKAISLAASYYVNHPSEQNSIKNAYGLPPSADDAAAIRFLAHMLDTNPERMAIFEALAQKDQAENSRSVINYQPPEAHPTVSQPSSQRVNCITNQIGDSSYTNCY